MNQEIEIEFKNLIDRKKYEELLSCYQSSRTPVYTQVNHYFDTDKLSLKDKKSALRVRYKKGAYILTLKQPYETGLLETHQQLSEEEFSSLKEHGSLSEGDVFNQLSQLLEENVPKLDYLGQLTTERTEISLKEGLLVLDKSYYFDHVDYEIEFECEEFASGKQAFKQLLNEWDLSWNEPANKIERFYSVKIQREQD
ncbi:CYTH domain-containing protein [Salipaludibacillus sp. CUR1]|uniref:CYTH domain-containing protein n=1 Tax=Salipaludibacillus sp. CUR1 TaxID=2820003 RepID=UPI001E40A438|nr:CYTH domain-containing protein [Salipaludibacillus sp. CUR1]MCE7794856.1 CYTH domain-containing protein [Salipaludibacillus sp. CUR1]